MIMGVRRWKNVRIRHKNIHDIIRWLTDNGLEGSLVDIDSIGGSEEQIEVGLRVETVRAGRDQLQWASSEEDVFEMCAIGIAGM